MDEHPDADEIEQMLEEAQHKLDTAFEVVFHISMYDAELLVQCWEDAQEGDTTAVAMLLAEMSKLITILTEELIETGEEDENL